MFSFSEHNGCKHSRSFWEVSKLCVRTLSFRHILYSLIHKVSNEGYFTHTKPNITNCDYSKIVSEGKSLLNGLDANGVQGKARTPEKPGHLRGHFGAPPAPSNSPVLSTEGSSRLPETPTSSPVSTWSRVFETGSAVTSAVETTETTSMQAAAKEGSIETTAKEGFIETTAKDASIETPSKETAVETSVKESVVETAAKDTVVETASKETAMETAAQETAMETGTVAAAAPTMATVASGGKEPGELASSSSSSSESSQDSVSTDDSSMEAEQTDPPVPTQSRGAGDASSSSSKLAFLVVIK